MKRRLPSKQQTTSKFKTKNNFSTTRSSARNLANPKTYSPRSKMPFNAPSATAISKQRFSSAKPAEHTQSNLSFYFFNLKFVTTNLQNLFCSNCFDNCLEVYEWPQNFSVIFFLCVLSWFFESKLKLFAGCVLECVDLCCNVWKCEILCGNVKERSR